MESIPLRQELNRFLNDFPRMKAVVFYFMNYLFLRSWYMQKEIKKWSKNQSGHKHVLDLGSGVGQYAHFILKTFPKWSVTGVDKSEKNVCHCNGFFRKAVFKNFRFRSFDEYSFYGKSRYDLIVSAEMLSDLDLSDFKQKTDDPLDEWEMVQKLTHLLKADGMLFFYWAPPQLQTNQGKEMHRHMRKRMVEELKKLGYKQVKTSYIFGFFGQFSWRLSMQWPSFMIQKWPALRFLLPLYFLFLFPFCFVFNYLDVHSAHLMGKRFLVKAYK